MGKRKEVNYLSDIDREKVAEIRRRVIKVLDFINEVLVTEERRKA